LKEEKEEKGGREREKEKWEVVGNPLRLKSNLSLILQQKQQPKGMMVIVVEMIMTVIMITLPRDHR
jgi:hypothetical protein